VTTNLDFKVTIFLNVKYDKKWYKIELYLRWQTDGRSYMIYCLVPFSVTLNDP